MSKRNEFSDQVLIDMLRNGSMEVHDEAFTIIYEEHKDYCTRFMIKKFGAREDIKDIYHDAVLVICECVNKPGWQLTCKIQTFMNSVCFHKCLTKFGNPKVALVPEDDIIDIIADIAETYFPMEASLNTERVGIIITVLEDEKNTSAICREIIIRSWFKRQSPEVITRIMSYKNTDALKNQKSRCLTALKKGVFKILNRH